MRERSRDGVPDAVVVGANGFLGARLVRRLTEAGRVVASFTRSRPLHHHGILERELREAPIIYYLAASVTPGVAERHPEKVAADHLELERLLADLKSSHAHPTVIFASSSTVYDPHFPPPYKESAHTHVETVYGDGKMRMEETLSSFADSIRPVIIRLASMYGPGHRTDPGHGVIAHWLTALSEGRPIDVIGHRDTRRDYIYVEDVVDGLLCLTDLPPNQQPEVLNIGSGESTSLAELLRQIIEVTGIQPTINYHPTREFDRRELWLDISRAQALLDWNPRTSLSEGLLRTWDSIASPFSDALPPSELRSSDCDCSGNP